MNSASFPDQLTNIINLSLPAINDYKYNKTRYKLQ